MFLIIFTFFLDEEPEKQNQSTNENIETEVIYEIPKHLNEVGMSYVTMKDFVFDSEQQEHIV